MNETNPHALILPTPAPGPTNSATNALESLRDIKAPVEIPGEWTWLWWTLGVLAAAVLLSALGVWLYRSRQKALYVSPIPAHVRALRRLAEALAFLIGDARAFCVEVSLTVRVYLEEQFKLKAPERTTEEFLHELQSSSLLNETQKKSLAHFLSRCDLVKFARYEPTEAELRDLHDSAVKFIEDTIPAPVLTTPSSPVSSPPAVPMETPSAPPTATA